MSESNALSHERQSIDIYSNSWGPSDNGNTVEAPGPLMTAAFEENIEIGRGGLGNIITWAAGNGLDDNDNSNYDGYANVTYNCSHSGNSPRSTILVRRTWRKYTGGSI